MNLKLQPPEDTSYKHLFYLSINEALALLLISTGVLTLAIYPLVQSKLIDTLSITSVDLKSYISTYTSSIVKSRVNFYLSVGLTWLVIGLAVYILILILAKLTVGVRNFFIYEHYYSHQRLPSLFALRHLVKAVLATATLGAVVLTTNLGVKLWVGIYTQAFITSSYWLAVLAAIIAIFGMAINLLLLVYAFRLFLKQL